MATTTSANIPADFNKGNIILAHLRAEAHKVSYCDHVASTSFVCPFSTKIATTKLIQFKTRSHVNLCKTFIVTLSTQIPVGFG